MAIYARAVAARTGRAPAQAVLFYLLPGRDCPVSVQPEDLQRLESTLLDLAARIRRGEFTPPSQPECARCPYALLCGRG